MVLADEVYQDNIYNPKKSFVSFRKVLNESNADIRDSVELVSFHSVSKGFLGECGLRGGYMELHNFNPAVRQILLKLKTIYLCSNSIGQITMDLKVRPPTEKDATAKTVQQYESEVKALLGDLTKKAKIVENALNSMKNIHCNPIEGAMYAFPRVDLPKKFIAEAESLGKVPDAYYCMLALQATGGVMVPGSGFRQREGTHHFRTTILPAPVTFLESKYQEFKKFNDDLMKKYSS